MSKEEKKKEQALTQITIIIIIFSFGPLLENVAGTDYLQNKCVMYAAHFGMFDKEQRYPIHNKKNISVKRNVPTACMQQVQIWVLRLHPGW